VKIAKVAAKHVVGASSVTWRLRRYITDDHRRLGGATVGTMVAGDNSVHRGEATLHKVEDDPREVEVEASQGVWHDTVTPVAC
jgi:hypothetical protein